MYMPPAAAANVVVQAPAAVSARSVGGGTGGDGAGHGHEEDRSGTAGGHHEVGALEDHCQDRNGRRRGRYGPERQQKSNGDSWTRRHYDTLWRSFCTVCAPHEKQRTRTHQQAGSEILFLFFHPVRGVGSGVEDSSCWGFKKTPYESSLVG
jgi:hypothetical protein